MGRVGPGRGKLYEVRFRLNDNRPRVVSSFSAHACFHVSYCLCFARVFYFSSFFYLLAFS